MGGFWRTFWALCFFRASRTLEKGGPGGPSKLDPFFGRFWDLPGGPQEGSRLHGSSILTFAARPKKGSKMGAKMEPFGLPNLNYTHFGAPFVRNWCPKSCIEKGLQNKVTPRLEGVRCTVCVCVCVEFAPPRGGEEEGEEEVLRRLVTPRGRRIFCICWICNSPNSACIWGFLLLCSN